VTIRRLWQQSHEQRDQRVCAQTVMPAGTKLTGRGPDAGSIVFGFAVSMPEPPE
jgi:hypothetical protein